MGNRRKSAKVIEREAYKYYFDSPWCPLFGSLLETPHIPNSPISQAIGVIEKARKLWGIWSGWASLEDIKIYHMYADNPEDFPRFYEGIPKDLLMSARLIFWRGIEIIGHAQLKYSPNHPTWHEKDNGEHVEYLAPEQVSDSDMTYEARLTIGVIREIKDWQIFSLLAISKAHWLLRATLEDDPPMEDENSPKVLSWLRTATAILTRATELKAQADKDKAQADKDKLEQRNKNMQSRIGAMVNKRKESGRKGGSAPKKREGIEAAIKELLEKKERSSSTTATATALFLWKKFRANYPESNAYQPASGHYVYFYPDVANQDDEHSGELIEIDGHRKKGLRFGRFKRYVSDVIKGK